MANADFMRFSLGVFSREQTTAFLDRVRARDRAALPSQFALILRSNEKLIGYCGFFLQTVDGVEEPEIAYRVDPFHWGQGLATEAARAVRSRGKTKKLALTALMRKLIVLANQLLKCPDFVLAN